MRCLDPDFTVPNIFSKFLILIDHLLCSMHFDPIQVQVLFSRVESSVEEMNSYNQFIPIAQWSHQLTPTVQ